MLEATLISVKLGMLCRKRTTLLVHDGSLPTTSAPKNATSSEVDGFPEKMIGNSLRAMKIAFSLEDANSTG